MSKKPTYEELERRIQALEKEALAHTRIEESLRESEERFRAVFEGSLDAILLVDPESGHILDANPTASELLLRTQSAPLIASDG